MESIKVLIIGYGNPGRIDDGLGPAVAEAILERNFPDVTVKSKHLLMVEDAADLAPYDVAIFADACLDGEKPFFFQSILPKTSNSFSSHSVEPEIVLGLARDLFGAKTKGYVLGVRGYEFDEFGQRLSRAARDNLLAAVQFLSALLEGKNFDQSLS